MPAPHDDRSASEAAPPRTAVRGVVGTLVVLGFVGWVVADLLSSQSITCEVCLTFKGYNLCETGAGPTEEDAVQSARSQVCAKLASGVTEAFACSSAPPTSLQCGAN